jgi:UDP-glucuronate 4-epimerase
VHGRRIVVTGVTGQVALPLARALARENEVWGLARFRDAVAREALERDGVRCVPVDLVSGDFPGVPTGIDLVLHFAVAHTRSFDKSLTANAEATGLLMSQFRDASAFFHCSSGAVYEPKGGPDPLTETDPLGDNHRVMMPAYSIAKISSEAVVRTCARIFSLPSVIARLNVPYGDNGGWPLWHFLTMQAGQPVPVNPDGSTYNLIHDDDILATLPVLVDAASVPATIVNWAGPETVTIEQWCTELSSLTGVAATFDVTPATLPTVVMDTTKLRELGGSPSVDWHDGLRRLVAAQFPDLLRA